MRGAEDIGADTVYVGDWEAVEELKLSTGMGNFEIEIEKIILLVSEGNPLAALDSALIIAKDHDQRTYKNFVHLKGRYKTLQERVRAGTLDFREESIETSLITKALIEYVSELENYLQKPQSLNWVNNAMETLRHEWTKLGELQEGRVIRLQEFAKAIGLNQRLLSTKIGVSQSYLNQIYCGKRSISGRFLANLLSVYPEINADWLLNGKGEMFTKKTFE